MPQQSPGSPDLSGVRTNLHAVAQMIREARHLGPDDRRLLAELVDELSKALNPLGGSSAEVARLADSTAHLLAAMHQEKDAGLLASARTRLEQAILDAESHAPLAVGIVRRLIETLAGTGI